MEKHIFLTYKKNTDNKLTPKIMQSQKKYSPKNAVPKNAVQKTRCPKKLTKINTDDRQKY